MEITVKSEKLAKQCSTQKGAIKKYGAQGGKKLMQRLTELRAAENLTDISYLPPARLHELEGKEKGQFSVDLDHPYRLLFISANDPIPMKEGGGFDKLRITEIEIIAIRDTH